MPAGSRSRRRIVEASGLLAREWVGVQFGSLTISSSKVEGSASNLRVEVSCGRCAGSHMALFHNIRKRPNTAACPHCNGRQPVTVPHWLYRRCQAQQDRCTNPQSTSFARYGAVGVEFRFAGPNEAASWIASNLGIADRAMEIDRINNDGHYEPGNLRWATPVQNIGNSRKSRGGRDRFLSFRASYPQVRYADRTLARLLLSGLTDGEIIARWNAPSCKPKGKYGTFSTLGLYRDSPLTDG